MALQWIIYVMFFFTIRKYLVQQALHSTGVAKQIDMGGCIGCFGVGWLGSVN